MPVINITREKLQLHIIVVIAGLGLFLIIPSPASAQACTQLDVIYSVESPGSSAKICDGTNLQVLRSAKSNPVREGIATANPEATLDVNGEVRVGNTSIACSATNAGAIRYNAGYVQWCNGTAWANISSVSSVTLPIDADTAPASKRLFSTNAGAYNLLGFRGTDNIYLGLRAATGLDTGGAGVANVIMGTYAGYNITSGSYNVFLGHSVGNSNTTGMSNTFVGGNSGYANTIGDKNTFLGLEAGGSNTTADDNTFLGHFAGRLNTTGNSNVFVGKSAGAATTSGSSNTLLGFGAGDINTTGARNILIGTGANAPLATTNDYLNVGHTFIGSMGTNPTTPGSGDASLNIDGKLLVGATTTPQSTLHVPDGKYMQAEDNNAGAPPAADCDNNAERGRLSIDTSNNRLYVCNGATRGWDYITLTD